MIPPRRHQRSSHAATPTDLVRRFVRQRSADARTTARQRIRRVARRVHT
jgi:hypothetical protein